MTPWAGRRRWFRVGLSGLILALAAACYLPPQTAPEGGCARPDNLDQVSGGEACFATMTEYEHRNSTFLVGARYKF